MRTTSDLVSRPSVPPRPEGLFQGRDCLPTKFPEELHCGLLDEPVFGIAFEVHSSVIIGSGISGPIRKPAAPAWPEYLYLPPSETPPTDEGQKHPHWQTSPAESQSL